MAQDSSSIMRRNNVLTSAFSFAEMTMTMARNKARDRYSQNGGRLPE